MKLSLKKCNFSDISRQWINSFEDTRRIIVYVKATLMFFLFIAMKNDYLNRCVNNVHFYV